MSGSWEPFRLSPGATGAQSGSHYWGPEPHDPSPETTTEDGGPAQTGAARPSDQPPSSDDQWPRAHNIEFSVPYWPGREVGLHFFRNADAGIALSVDLITGGWSRSRAWSNYTQLFQIGPGQCGTRTWNRQTNDRWCERPFGHDGEHAYSVTLTTTKETP